MNNDYESVLKSFLGKRILLAVSNINSGADHYYLGQLLEVNKESIKMLAELKRRFRRSKKNPLVINRKAFVVLYLTELKKK